MKTSVKIAIFTMMCLTSCCKTPKASVNHNDCGAPLRLGEAMILSEYNQRLRNTKENEEVVLITRIKED